MSLNVGELFVNLGIKGSDKTIGALSGIKKGMGETASMSLEAKAAIVGAIYALERLFAASGHVGTNLTNFNSLTGLSAKQLQQWQYAARQAGVANEDFAGSLKAVQTGMTNMLLGKGAPEGLALVANKVGFDPKRARDSFYVLEQLQKFAKTVPADVGNAVLKTFGISEGVIAAMRRNAFNPIAFAKAPAYSEKEIGALDRANIAWSNLGQKIEMAIGKFNAKHGGELVRDISLITDSIFKLINAFVVLAEKLHVFQFLGATVSALTEFIKLTSGAVESISGTGKKDQNKEKGKSGIFDFLQSLTSFSPSDYSFKPNSIAPSVKGSPSGSQQNININQNLNFQHDGKDHKRTGDSVKKANQDALRQFNQGQVS